MEKLFNEDKTSESTEQLTKHLSMTKIDPKSEADKFLIQRSCSLPTHEKVDECFSQLAMSPKMSKEELRKAIKRELDNTRQELQNNIELYVDLYNSENCSDLGLQDFVNLLNLNLNFKFGDHESDSYGFKTEKELELLIEMALANGDLTAFLEEVTYLGVDDLLRLQNMQRSNHHSFSRSLGRIYYVHALLSRNKQLDLIEDILTRK